MNKVSLVFLVFLTSLSWNLSARAGNLVAFPTGDAKWTVNTEASDSAPARGAPNPYVTTAEVTQIKDVKRVVLNWSDGKTSEKWLIPGLPVEFEEDPRDGRVSTFQNGGLHENLTKFFMTYDGFAFDWVTEATLKEKTPIDYQGKQCYHFVSSASAMDSGTTFKREAWIDSTTLLPVAYDNGVSLSKYTFDPKPPQGPLDFPPAFKVAVHYYKSVMGYR